MLTIIRGAGDLATGVIFSLYKSGFKLLVLETTKPSAIRRTVAFSECIYCKEKNIEEVKAKKVKNLKEIETCWEKKEIPIIVDEKGDWIHKLKPDIVIDAIIAKKNLGTQKNMAPITIALGPGFVAGKDVDLVIETMRGHNLGKIILTGQAESNTGVPGEIAGVSKERVVYAETSGVFKELKRIGDIVKKGEVIGIIDETPIHSTIDGLLRGIIRSGYKVKKGLKIADIDPRLNQYENCFTISDKARTLGGAVLEGVLTKIMEKGEVNGLKYFGENI
ncbi:MULTISPECIES: selenium-dependent molybdenum cofactor biosynthesis protein YqeB [Cetobacterium]|jgi:xanthine dehydrogenase accessory factor|uniref:Selenium-dependent molybdenum cofactor biosynthesis protein YqeB n=1 Tax=Candidatus Cetobacterium colombiensis TaxID=3073100 RepID=A0ABU4WCX6_9FUSO|nr:selenium-dependent molybdenum cofactor biosynthesis protein YqeB [Candidatus Cetobacterium colombiensis]MDX8337378.1 selenium-dependent molybdenum cofactor biosynthesis protein YqeB [Candidatus Cetobacterium colombiensis]